MTILITGARAPIALDLAAMFATNTTVHLCDSLWWPWSKFSPHVASYTRVAAPAKNLAQFELDILSLVQQHGITQIWPTSEEVFWLMQCPAIAPMVAAPSLEVLDTLHNKHSFHKLMESLGYATGDAQVIQGQEQLEALADREDLANYVLKPVYSRFGSQAMVALTEDQVRTANPSVQWLAQAKVAGKELCVYSLVKGNRVLGWASYTSRLKANAGLFMVSKHTKGEVEKFLKAVVSALDLPEDKVVQLSFDLMSTASGLKALECNPRGTSGVHLWALQKTKFLKAAIASEEVGEVMAHKPVALWLPIMVHCYKEYWSNKVLNCWMKHAHLIGAPDCRPYVGLIPSAIELGLKALRHRCSIQEASTKDIEWNGPGHV